RALESVLTNLVQNSVIHGHATEVEVNVQRTNGRLNVSVIDNGRGFHGDERQLGKLFVRHARSSGSGVGLYIARRLAHAMNGGIKCRGGEGGGFVAELELPEAGTQPSGLLSDERHAGGVSSDDRHAGGVSSDDRHAGGVSSDDRHAGGVI